MEMKSLTLSAKEIDQLLSIDDPEERLKTRQFIAKAMADPTSVHAADYREGSKTIYAVARRIERRVKAADRRRERQAAKPAVKTSSVQNPTSSIINVFATNGTVHAFHQSTQTMLRAVEIMLRQHTKYSSRGERDPVCDYLKDLYSRLQTVQDTTKFKARPDLNTNITCITFTPI